MIFLLALLLAPRAFAQSEGDVRRGMKELQDRKAAEACRSEHSSRWAIKTLTDADAAALQKSEPQDATIKELHQLAMPAKTKSPSRWDEEKKLRRVRGVILGWQLEEDEDIHMVLADAKDRRETLIMESPKPGCAGRSAFAEDFKRVRAVLESRFGKPDKPLFYHRLKEPVAVTVVGPAFFDVIHGKQEGESKNGVEIHPILSLEFDRP